MANQFDRVRCGERPRETPGRAQGGRQRSAEHSTAAERGACWKSASGARWAGSGLPLPFGAETPLYRYRQQQHSWRWVRVDGGEGLHNPLGGRLHGGAAAESRPALWVRRGRTRRTP